MRSHCLTVPLSPLHTVGRTITSKCDHSSLTMRLAVPLSLSSKLSLLRGRLHALLVSEVAQTAQHSRVRVAHECDVAEPFTERAVLEGEVLIVRCLVTCQVVQQGTQCTRCHVIGVDEGGERRHKACYARAAPVHRHATRYQCFVDLSCHNINKTRNRAQ
jgi:hypothetical protein